MGADGTGVFTRLGSRLSGWFSFKSSKSVVGLSIGTASVKLAELERQGTGWRMVHFGIAPLPEDAVVNREIVNPVAVVDAVRTLLGQLSLGNTQVCTAISGSSVIIKRMTVDVPNPKEMEDQIFWEAEQYLPFDVSEVAMDFELLSQPGIAGPADVMLVAVKRSVLDSYVGCITDSGLKPSVVDVDFFALQNAVEATYPTSSSEAVAAVDIGASSLKLVVMQGGVPVFTKDSALGGNSLTSEIQKHLNLSFADAENLKVSPATSGVPQEVSELTHIMCENYAQEIKRAIDFYSASSSGAPVAYVVLSGGTSRIPELSRMVEESLGLPTQNLNPFNSIAYDPAVFTPEYLAEIAPLAAIPVGLALRAGAGK